MNKALLWLVKTILIFVGLFLIWELLLRYGLENIMLTGLIAFTAIMVGILTTFTRKEGEE